MLNQKTGYNFGDLRSVLEVLRDSEFDFKLTGSRHFGCYTQESDFDFYVKYSKEVLTFLREYGFTLITNEEGYSDIPDTLVYRLGNVDVQVRQNFLAFDRLNRWMGSQEKAVKYLQSLNKKDRRQYWSFLLKLVV